jgi:hypothetical protein
MDEKEMTLFEFQNRFASEDDCLDALEKLRWPSGFRCPNCEHDDGYRLTKRRLIQCSVCRHQTSVTAGTIFHKTTVSLCNWFWMIYLMAQDKGGASSSRIAKQLGMHYRTVWHQMHKIRHAMACRDEQVIELAGVIELDEAIFGAEARKPRTEETKRGKGSNKEKPHRRTKGRPRQDEKRRTEVLVMIESEGDRAGHLVMKVIDGKTTREAIRETVEQRVEDQRQLFRTDALQSHWVLKDMGHDVKAVVCSGELSVHWLPWVHTAISLVRRYLVGTFHGVGADRLQSYLDEFCFRFNRRFKENQITWSLLNACALALPIQYAELKS